MWQIVGTEKTTGKRILLATADNETERAMILCQERADRDQRRKFESIKAVKVWS